MLAIAAILIATPDVSQAHPWGPYYGYPVGENIQFANNSTHVFCYNNLTDLSVAVANDARVQAMGEPTNMVTDRDCTGARVDVVANDSFYGTGVGWRGVYSCRSLNGEGTCALADVYVNLDLVGDEAQRRKTFCHEFGHSIGLRHNVDRGCMQSGSATANFYLPEIEIAEHINRRY